MIKKSDVGKWTMDIEPNFSVGDFNNVTENGGVATFPGERGDAAATYFLKNQKPLFSETLEIADYLYIHKGKNYFYGIKKDNTEVIASLDGDSIIPLVAGAGGFEFRDENNTVRFSSGAIERFVENESDGKRHLTVYYKSDADCEFVRENKTTYCFGNEAILVEAFVDAEDFHPELCGENCFFARRPLNDCDRYQKRVAYYWNYPENNDYTHKESDAFVLSEDYGNTALYTFIRDENSAHQFEFCYLTRERMPLQLTEKWPFFVASKKTMNAVKYKYNFDLVFVDNKNTAAYYALFKGKNSDFAAGVCAVTKDDNASYFLGKEITLNLNVTNISDRSINYSVRYNIINHYNETVASGIWYNNTLGVGESANRNLDLHLENYGMHYLNYYVVSDNFEHRELYPFATVEPYEFKYRAQSPFGICAPYTNSPEECDAAAKLLGKMGIASIRMDKQNKNFELSRLLRENGITRQGIGIAYNRNPDDVEGYMEQVRELAHDWMDKVEFFFMSNEYDKFCKNNYDKSLKSIKEDFIPHTFAPAYEFFKNEYPEKLKNIVWESNCHGSTEWLEAFYETGLWDKSDIIDIHSYSNPSGPDKVYSNQLVSIFSNLLSNEYAAVRWKRIQNRYGKKRVMFGETGYHTSVHDKRENDIRTAADFNVRIALIFLEAGAEIINYYCLFDRTSRFVGSSTWNELYLGAWHNTDYYGTYMPKPWAAAYANLTRRMDGVKKCTFFKKYEEDEWGTLRAYKVECEDNNFAVLWSNIYKLPNTTAQGRVNNTERIPMPLWENRWIITETREFDVVGDNVTVIDVMGNSKTIVAKDGKVQLEISGSPIFVYGLDFGQEEDNE